MKTSLIKRITFISILCLLACAFPNIVYAQSSDREFVIVNFHANQMNYFSLAANGTISNSNSFDPMQHIWHFVEHNGRTVLYNNQGFYVSANGNKITTTPNIANAVSVVFHENEHKVECTQLGGYLRYSNTWTFNGSSGSQGTQTTYEVVTTHYDEEITGANIIEPDADLLGEGNYPFTHTNANGRVGYNHYHFLNDDQPTGFVVNHYWYIKNGVWGDFTVPPDPMTFTYTWTLDSQAQGYATVNSNTGTVTLNNRPVDDYVYTILTLNISSDAPYAIYNDTDQITLRIVPPMWTNMVTSLPTDEGYKVEGDEVIISTDNGLGWLISVVNGYNGCAADDMAGKIVRLTSDVDMEEYIWTPIGENGNSFKGTFDGGGFEITGLRCQLTGQESTGLFATVDGGVVENTFVTDCNFIYKGTTAGHIGIIVDTLSNGAVLHSSEAAGSLQTGNTNLISMGGLVGLVDGSITHSSMSVATLTGYNIGGAAGTVTATGIVRNSFTNNIYVGTEGGSITANGLAYVNATASNIDNCYVRVRWVSPANGFNVLGTVASGNYYPEGFNSSIGSSYTATSTPYMYDHNDNKVGDERLLDCLNRGVGTNEAEWMRTTAGPGNGGNINDDYPVLMLNDFDAMGSREGAVLLYGQANYMLSKMDQVSYSLDIYRSVAGLTNNNAATLYINEDVALLGNAILNAYVGITLDNSAGTNGANPSVGGTDAIDWHMFSSSLSNAPLGIDYNGDNTQYPFSWGHPDGMPQYGFYPESVSNGYFPSNTPYESFDFYCFTEPDYHWVNFKRNGVSHWHEDEPHDHINYRAVPSAEENVNESTLISGKGYLVAIDKNTFIQSQGTLNNGDISIDVTRQGAHKKGYNLLGNPYQSYLDFDAFAEENASLWETNVTKYSNSYILLDEDQKGYVSYTPGTSKGANAAPRYINMHQGFMILADNAGTATFTDDMRGIDQTPDFRGEGQPAYPLVNLRVTDANGNCENLVVEMNRPDCGGARKAKGLRMGKGQFYAHHEDGDYAIFFAREGMRQVPLYFETDVDDTFVLTWDIQNGQFHDLRLVDNITGANVDMSQNGQYVFQSSATDYKSRFKLVFDVTGLEEDEDGMASDSFAFVNNGLLVVNAEGQMDIVDLNGRVVYSSTLTSPQSVIDLNHLSHGLYVLKIAGQKSLMTQKIVF